MEILRALDRYLVTGAGDIKPLSPPLEGLRLRVGDWRVLFEPSPIPNAIVVSSVAHRSEAYRHH
jgi:mRNA-degrading endonuclease RelE of RelBE toxin-antitoxin system